MSRCEAGLELLTASLQMVSPVIELEKRGTDELLYHMAHLL